MKIQKPLSAAISLALSSGILTLSTMPAAYANQTTTPLESVAKTAPTKHQTTQLATAEQQPERFEVTGSRIKRVDLEGVAPVTVITAESIEVSGFSSVEELMQASIFNSGRTIQGNESSWTQGANTINMRGMGENRTLVLVNGKRIPQYPTATGGTTNFVDTSTFPTSAIERIEILSGGASAIYGSDAVGGVVNIILKKEFDGTQLDVRHENPQQGGGDKTRFTLTQGFNSRLGQTMLVLQYRDDEILRSGQRKFTSQGGPDRNNTYSSTSARLEDTNSVFHRSRFIYATEQQCQDLFGSYGIWVASEPDVKCRYDSTRDVHLQSAKEEWNLVLNHQGELSDVWSYNAMVQVSDRETLRGNGQKSISPVIFMDRNNPGKYSYSATEFSRSNRFRVHRRLDDYGQRSDYTGLQDTLNSAFGLTGQVGTFDLEASWAYGKSSFERIGRNQMLADKLLEVISFNPADSANPAKWYPMDKMTQEQVKKLYAETLTDAGSGLNQFTTVLSGDVTELPAGALQFAWSAEWAKEWYFDHKDENTLKGNLLGQGGTQGRGERKRYATAAELAIPLFDAPEGVGKVDASLALRYDYYDDQSDVGGAVTPQGGFTYRPTEHILLRLNGGKTFRAPDLHRVYALPTLSFGNTRNHVDPAHPRGTDDQYEQISSGSLDLTEEKGRFYNFGIVAQLTDDLSIDVDYWRISLKGAVRSASVTRMLQDPTFDVTGKYSNCNAIPGLGFIMQQQPDNAYRDILCVKNGAINSALEVSQGIDTKIRYSMDLASYGRVTLSGDISRSLAKDYQAFADQPRVDNLKESNFPEFKAGASVGYQFEKFRANLNWSYIGSTEGKTVWTLTDASGKAYNEERFSRLDPFSSFNLVTSYDYSDMVKMTLGVTNLTDQLPPTYVPGHPWRNSWPYYDDQSGYNAIGRSFYAELRYKF